MFSEMGVNVVETEEATADEEQQADEELESEGGELVEVQQKVPAKSEAKEPIERTDDDQIIKCITGEVTRGKRSITHLNSPDANSPNARWATSHAARVMRPILEPLAGLNPYRPCHGSFAPLSHGSAQCQVTPRAPRRVISRMPTESLRAIRCLISWIQFAPDGGRSAGDGKQGSMKRITTGIAAGYI